MDTKKQYDMFKSLKGTVEKLESLQKSMADKTTDAIIADIEDSNNTAQVASNPGLSSKNPTMVKGKPKDQSKGVHKPYMSGGESMAGELAREGKNKPGKMGEQNKDVSRSFHKQKLNELKSIPKPNLPKSEEMTKGEATAHPGKLKDKEYHKKDKAVEAHGNKFDKNPSAENHAKLATAIKDRDDHIAKNPATKAHINQLNTHMNEKWGGNRPMLKTEEFIAELKKVRDDIKKQEDAVEPKFDKLKAFMQKREEKRNK